ncbi:MAG TPA: HIT domain-containing protein [Bryobacteraceae bacterium]|jgi:ATP adenylyltransferase
MDRLWTPWRYHYVSTAGTPKSACIFCDAAASDDDRGHYVVLRAERNFLILNLYPYTSGHLMIAPYEHVSTLGEAHPETLAEMMRLTVRVEQVLRQVYKPDGLNIGMNLGNSAGAGVPGHIHMHALPRWNGDANFMTTIAETRVLPETIEATYDRVKAALSV